MSFARKRREEGGVDRGGDRGSTWNSSKKEGTEEFMEGAGGWWLKEQLPRVRWVWEPGGFCPDAEPLARAQQGQGF